MTSSLAMLERLVAFDTTSRNSNLDLIRFVQDYLSGFGIASELVENEERTKANLWATIGPPEDGGIVLSGHTDVVPVDGQPWSSDPWTVTKREGRLYGRGTADMKAFSAVALAMIPEFVKAPLRRPVHLALSYDEEIGCLGVHSLVAHIMQKGVRPSLAVIGEPTMMRVVDAHKGIRSYFVEVTGHEAHSSNVHKGVSAVMVAAELIGELARIAQMMRAKGDPSGRFDPPYTTVVANVIEGGTAQNILARRAKFSWECRHLPEQDPEEALRLFRVFAEKKREEIKLVSPSCDIEIIVRGSVPPLMPEPGSQAEVTVKSLASRNVCEAVSYGTEAGIFQAGGIAAIVCGPGDIAQAHQPDEFLDEDQLPACEAFMRRLIGRLSG